jgi:hypothetical protein
MLVKTTIVRLYDDYRNARYVVAELEGMGIPSEDISVIANNAGDRLLGGGATQRDDEGSARRRGTEAGSAGQATSPTAQAAGSPGTMAATPETSPAGGGDTRKPDKGDESSTTEGALLGVAVGGTLGTAVGILAGLAMLTIPGLGPVAATGWLAAMVTGAVVGSATGGIVGALVYAGVSEEDAPVYAEGIRRGGSVVSARVPDSERARTEKMMNAGAVDAQARRAQYEREGWRGFDASAPAHATAASSERPTTSAGATAR